MAGDVVGAPGAAATEPKPKAWRHMLPQDDTAVPPADVADLGADDVDVAPAAGGRATAIADDAGADSEDEYDADVEESADGEDVDDAGDEEEEEVEEDKWVSVVRAKPVVNG